MSATQREEAIKWPAAANARAQGRQARVGSFLTNTGISGAQICESLLRAHAGLTLAGFHALLTHAAEAELAVAGPLIAAVQLSGESADAAVTVMRGDSEGEPDEGDAGEDGWRLLAAAYRLAKVGQALGRLEAVEHVRELARRGCIPGAAGAGGGEGVGARVRTAVGRLLASRPDLSAQISGLYR
jgi:hypothetical protein